MSKYIVENLLYFFYFFSDDEIWSVDMFLEKSEESCR